MKNYILNGNGNGKRAIFYFSLGIIAICLLVGLPLIYFGVAEAPKGIDLNNAYNIIGVIFGFSLVIVTASWVSMCIFAWITSWFVTRKLNKPQRKRFAAIYYILYTIIMTFVSPLSIFVDPQMFNISVIILYFVFLKIFDQKLIR